MTDMTPAISALESVTLNHPSLPAALLHVRGATVGAEQVIDVQFNHDAEAFAAWCEAFEVDDSKLDTREGAFNWHTTTVTRYAGVTFVLYLNHRQPAWRPEAVAA
jgi:hypothetical protein